jgi:hypothetical protein
LTSPSKPAAEVAVAAALVVLAVAPVVPAVALRPVEHPQVVAREPKLSSTD